MRDLVSRQQWDNILKLLVLTMLSDGRNYEREVDSFVDTARTLRQNMPVAGILLSLIHISEPTRLLSISYAVFCLKKKK